MADTRTKPTDRICPEPVLNAAGEPTGKVCGIRHMSMTVDTCPEHMGTALVAFWLTMGTTVPDTTPHPEPPPEPAPKRRRSKRRR
jgi:hypothetical protein